MLKLGGGEWGVGIGDRLAAHGAIVKTAALCLILGPTLLEFMGLMDGMGLTGSSFHQSLPGCSSNALRKNAVC